MNVQDTNLLLLDALNSPMGLIVKVSEPITFTRRCKNLIREECYPLLMKVVKNIPDEIWIVRSPNGGSS